MPPTTSPTPSSSAMPSRIWGPRRTSAMSPRRYALAAATGTVFPPDPNPSLRPHFSSWHTSGVAQIFDPSQVPAQRTKYCASAISSAHRLIRRWNAAPPHRRRHGRDVAAQRLRVDHHLVFLDHTADGGDLRNTRRDCNSYFRNQSRRLRTCARSCPPVRSTSAYL